MLVNMLVAFPSPPQGTWSLGPVPVRAYALIIISGVVVAVWWGDRRWRARGGRPGEVADVALWAVPVGIIGARAYHVITDWDAYFGADGRGVWGALRVWDGGLGIWGGISAGAVCVWVLSRRRGWSFARFADAIVPGVAVAQAIGRWGNWFNQELFGRPTDVPWAVQIDLVHRPVGYEQYATFHPTFLYESLWCLGVATALVLVDRRRRLAPGGLAALYVLLYVSGRAVIETFRIDPAPLVAGIRLNVFTSGVVGIAAVIVLVRLQVAHRRAARDAETDGVELTGGLRSDDY